MSASGKPLTTRDEAYSRQDYERKGAGGLASWSDAPAAIYLLVLWAHKLVRRLKINVARFSGLGGGESLVMVAHHCG